MVQSGWQQPLGPHFMQPGQAYLHYLKGHPWLPPMKRPTHGAYCRTQCKPVHAALTNCSPCKCFLAQQAVQFADLCYCRQATRWTTAHTSLICRLKSKGSHPEQRLPWYAACCCTPSRTTCEEAICCQVSRCPALSSSISSKPPWPSFIDNIHPHAHALPQHAAQQHTCIAALCKLSSAD